MLNKSKIALIAVIAAVGAASPAFAQSVDHTGTLFASYYDNTGKQKIGAWAPQAAAPRAAGPQFAANRNERAVQGRHLYATTVAPYAATVAPSVSGYDPSIASQR